MNTDLEKRMQRIPAPAAGLQPDRVDACFAIACRCLAVAFLAALLGLAWALIGCPGIDLLGLPA